MGLLGLFCLNWNVVIAVIFLLVAAAWIYKWNQDCEEKRSQVTLNFLMNSGTVFSLLFHDMDFLNKVQETLTAILSKEHHTENVIFNIKDNVFQNDASVIRGKMKTKFIIEGNNFYDNSSVIRVDNKDNDETLYPKIEQELREIKEELNPNKELFNAISDLQKAVERRNKAGIGKTITNYMREFTSSFFINISSSALLEFIKTFF